MTLKHTPQPHISAVPISGAAMDRVVPRNARRRYGYWLLAGPGVALLATSAWFAIPRGYAVNSSELQIESVASGVFRDELAVRANAEALISVLLDAVEGGRVESVVAKDGALVKKGELLFKLSNPQFQQQILARESDVAQQTSNVESLRSTLATSRSDHQRRLAELEYELARIEKTHARDTQLAAKGFLSGAVLDESADKLAQQRRLLDEERRAMHTELRTRDQALNQMEGMLVRLRHGLTLVQQGVAALDVRAPVDGRLTDFRLQEGESIKPGDKLGRVDAPDRFKLNASIDEFYLSRVAPGLKGSVVQEGKNYPVEIARINPQIKDRRFAAELLFDGAATPQLKPGQSVDVRIALGQPTQALLLPDAAFYRETGGAWVYALTADGKAAERRTVQLGRRAGGQIEVLNGLKSGDRVITSSYSRFGTAERLRLD